MDNLITILENFIKEEKDGIKMYKGLYSMVNKNKKLSKNKIIKEKMLNTIMKIILEEQDHVTTLNYIINAVENNV